MYANIYIYIYIYTYIYICLSIFFCSRFCRWTAGQRLARNEPLRRRRHSAIFTRMSFRCTHAYIHTYIRYMNIIRVYIYIYIFVCLLNYMLASPTQHRLSQHPSQAGLLRLFKKQGSPLHIHWLSMI